MPKKRIISLAESAFADLQNILVWYKDQQVPDAGESLVREIIAKMERLADFPESGRIVPEFGIANLREIIFPSYRIVYRLDVHAIKVVRVWRSERLLKTPE
ncbi:MAG TPA: type II toxin-antitoxin system RelE/ParE family toxin [Smithellaceae bacterium]|nr:type II toxin-antitoxin system RelE/ParE family toxin [Smithellaceae bacterium]